MAKPNPLHLITKSEPPVDITRVCGIVFNRHEHESRCIAAWRAREHPAWSQYASAVLRVTERPKLRGVAG